MQNRETSEEFAREQENANKGWEICYGASAKAYLEWMDQMLEQGTAEAHEKLLAFFEDENKTGAIWKQKQCNDRDDCHYGYL